MPRQALKASLLFFFSISGKLLLILASTVILGSWSRDTHDRILPSHDSYLLFLFSTYILYLMHFGEAGIYRQSSFKLHV
jgi:hypothetical protein